MTQQVLGKLLVDNYDSGREVRGHSGKPGRIFGGLNLEIGVGQNGGHRTQHHGAGKYRHGGDSLRHDNDDPITRSYALIQ